MKSKIIVTILLATLAGCIGATATLFAVAMRTSVPVVFMGCALAVLVVTATGIAYLRLHSNRKLWIKVGILSASIPLVLITILQLILQPHFLLETKSTITVKFWQLPGGSRIAYTKIPAAHETSKEPIIFLHGGPGVSDMQGDNRYFSSLASLDHDVYIYDELGTGLSSRLQDPSGYGVERDTRDLEEIRAAIHAEKVIAIGHSYGSGIAMRYAAYYPNRVSRLILSSPGSITTGTDADSGQAIQARLEHKQKLDLYSHLLEPRALVTYLLLQVNPKAAHEFSSDDIMDPRFNLVYEATKPAMHCKSSPIDSKNLINLGFYASQIPQSATYTPPSDIHEQLTRVTTPTLIIKPSCDYLPWKSIIVYKEALKKAPVTLVYIKNAGHNSYQDQPNEYFKSVSAFLSDQPVPSAYLRDSKPEDFNDDL